MTGTFRFCGMVIEVQEHRGEHGSVSHWLRRVDTDPETTIGVRSHAGLALARGVRLDQVALDRALAAFLRR